MPTVSTYRRSPLVDLAFTPVSDAAVHADGLQQVLWNRLQPCMTGARLNALDRVLAEKLNGRAQSETMPDLNQAQSIMVNDTAAFAAEVRAAVLISTMNRDKDGMLHALEIMRSLYENMDCISEENLFAAGADLLRAALELYRRSGQKFLLELIGLLRSRLPDVSGVMHVFPFQQSYNRPKNPEAGQEEYYDRMERLATGHLTADSMAMCALLSQYSGSGRDSAAPKAGLSALDRYHGMPSGAFSADPWLGGSEPARAADISAVCAFAEACHDALCTTGETVFAEKLEKLLVNVLPDLISAEGIRAMSPTNRLYEDESCDIVMPKPQELSAMLKALYALRRSVWLARDDETILYMLPVSGGCLTRMLGVPVRFTAVAEGVGRKNVTITVECREDVHMTFVVRIPGYAKNPQASVNNARPQNAPVGELYAFNRTFRNGDVITLSWDELPRVEQGARGCLNVYAGPALLALSLPDSGCAWRYALDGAAEVGSTSEKGVPYALAVACEAPNWQEKDGFILPPPRSVAPGTAYELTLIPFAGTRGRIASFPAVSHE